MRENHVGLPAARATLCCARSAALARLTCDMTCGIASGRRLVATAQPTTPISIMSLKHTCSVAAMTALCTPPPPLAAPAAAAPAAALAAAPAADAETEQLWRLRLRPGGVGEHLASGIWAHPAAGATVRHSCPGAHPRLLGAERLRRASLKDVSNKCVAMDNVRALSMAKGRRP